MLSFPPNTDQATSFTGQNIPILSIFAGRRRNRLASSGSCLTISRTYIGAYVLGFHDGEDSSKSHSLGLRALYEVKSRNPYIRMQQQDSLDG